MGYVAVFTGNQTSRETEIEGFELPPYEYPSRWPSCDFVNGSQPLAKNRGMGDRESNVQDEREEIA